MFHQYQLMNKKLNLFKYKYIQLTNTMNEPWYEAQGPNTRNH